MDRTPDSTPARARPARILVAEDDLEMRRLVVESLQADGHEAVDVMDGGQLLVQLTSFDRLVAEPIDLIVTDIRMPAPSGLEIVQTLREAEWKTPIVIMTAFGDPETRARARSLGAVLLEKPFKMRTLRGIVRALLRGTIPGDAPL
ncbi:MAG: response regulator transcription factor [Polyangiaceae bacterium]